MLTFKANDIYITRPLTEAQLQTVYASDQEMYPAPLTFERLRSWVDAAPEFSIAFYLPPEDDITASCDEISPTTSSPIGILIVLPLIRKHWEDLLVGNVKEIEVDPATMFPSSYTSTGGKGEEHGAVEVGLHVFHIEKFQTSTESSTAASLPSYGPRSDLGGVEGVAPRKGFAEIVIGEALDRATSTVGNSGKRWKVLGLSALTATEAGKRTFMRMEYTPTGYKEMFVTTANNVSGNEEIKMVFAYPENGQGYPDAVGLGAGVVVSEPSEMVVKYL